MSPDEAILVIRNINSSLADCIDAASVLADDPKTPLDHLAECLKRQGLCAEIAAIKLYARTGRGRKDETLGAVSLDYDDWIKYLHDGA